jgi:hypothetical protein
MKHLKKSFTLLMLLTLIIGSATLAQDLFNFDAKLRGDPAKEETQRNDNATTGNARLTCNPVMVPVNESIASIASSSTVARDLFYFDSKLRLDQAKRAQARLERAKEVMQDNQYTITGYEKGIFLCSPLMLNGRPLDYGEFDMRSKGELTVVKGAAQVDQTIQIPFYVYLIRNENKILIPGKEKPDPKQIKIETSEIFEHAERGDYLVIEAVNKEDGAVKRILKLIGGGC